MTMMPRGVQNPLLHTAGAGLSAYQQEIVLPSKVGAAAGAMALQSENQRMTGMVDAARSANTAQDTEQHRAVTAMQAAQAEAAQAEAAQALVSKHKLGAMSCCGMEPKYLPMLAQMAGAV